MRPVTMTKKEDQKAPTLGEVRATNAAIVSASCMHVIMGGRRAGICEYKSCRECVLKKKIC